MIKEKLPWLLLDAIFLIVFNIIFFLVKGFDNQTSVWISYAIVHFSYITLLITSYVGTSGRSSAVFSFSLYYVSSVYFFWNLVINILMMWIEPESYIFTASLNSIVTGIYLVIFIANIIANNSTAKKELIKHDEVFFIKNMSYELGIVLGKVKNSISKSNIEKVRDAIKNSPSKSSPPAKSIEQDIQRSIAELKNSDIEDSTSIELLTADLLQKIRERNKILRLQN